LSKDKNGKSSHSDDSVRHLDVGSPYPGTEEGPKGLAVR